MLLSGKFKTRGLFRTLANILSDVHVVKLGQNDSGSSSSVIIIPTTVVIIAISPRKRRRC